MSAFSVTRWPAEILRWVLAGYLCPAFRQLHRNVALRSTFSVVYDHLDGLALNYVRASRLMKALHVGFSLLHLLAHRASPGIDILCTGTITRMLSYERIMALNSKQLPVVGLLGRNGRPVRVQSLPPFLVFPETYHVNGIKSETVV